MRTETKVEYRIPGILVPEVGSQTVDHRDPQRALAQIPENAYAFRFYTLTYLTATTELGETVEMPPTQSDASGWYYPGGSIYDLATIEELATTDPGQYRILAANMRHTWERVVLCRTGNWQPFEAGDELLPLTPTRRT